MRWNIKAFGVRVADVARRAEARGSATPDLSGRSKTVSPIALITKEGELQWNDDIVKRLEELSGSDTRAK